MLLTRFTSLVLAWYIWFSLRGVKFVFIVALKPAFFILCFSCYFSIMLQDARVENYLTDSLLMYLQKCWWILCVKINQLPKVVSASSSPLLPLPFLISTIYCCHTQIPDRHFSSPFFLHLFLSHFNTSTSRGPCSSIHTPFPHALSLILS